MKIKGWNYPKASGPMVLRRGPITGIAIHHTAGPATQTPGDIDREERNVGYSMIPYEYLVYPNGDVYLGRSIRYVSAATYGANERTVAICCVGNYQDVDPTPEMLGALTQLVIYLHRNIPTIIETKGHRDYGAQASPTYVTLCPGDHLYSHIPDVRAKTLEALTKHGR